MNSTFCCLSNKETHWSEASMKHVAPSNSKKNKHTWCSRPGANYWQMYSTLSIFHSCPAWDGKTTQKTTKQLEWSRSDSKAMTLGRDVITALKQPQHNGEILSQRSAASEISHVTDRQNPSKAKNQSSSFSSFNHDGQLQRRAVDEITPTQTTKPSLQRIASSPSFYCHSVSLSVSFLSVFFSVPPSFYSPLQSPSRAE